MVYPPIIITNIIINEFFPYRGFILNSNKMEDDEIVSNMEKIGYIRINAINIRNPRGIKNNIIIIILKNNDNNGSELKKIKKIIESIDGEEVTKLKTLDEVFIIVNKEFFDRKNFNDIIRDLHNRQKNNEDSPYYTICPYHNFAFSVPKCKIIYPHEIMTKEEVSDFLQKERISIKDLPIILTTDVTVIWNGARQNDVIRILRKSESSLESVYYRRVEYAIR
jgi:DNA-directed RNA polymerase subunit H (RpoH/RPB5)